MSAIGGIYNFDNAPIDVEMFGRLSAALNDKGPDGGHQIQNGSVGMIYRAFHTNKESRMEKQPLVTRYGHILTWDGRLDNRDDLLREFPYGYEGDKTDVALVMAAYLIWGIDFIKNLIGDYALSLWDSPNKRLLLARDPFGARTLYYHTNKDQIVWSSALEALLKSTTVNIEVDNDYIGGFLLTHPDMWRTPYRNLVAVEPGLVVTTHNNSIITQRFWSPDPKKEIRYKTNKEYEEHFQQLFRESVRCRLRTDGPVWAELSGGLDSSSIVCMADKIISDGEISQVALETVSCLDNTSFTFSDNQFVGYVEKQRGRQGLHLMQDGSWVHFVSPYDVLISKPSPSLCVNGQYEQIVNAMEQHNARIILSGLGGDQLLWSTPIPEAELGDLTYQCHFGKLHKHLQLWSQIEKLPYMQLLFREAILPLAPTFIKNFFRRNNTIANWYNGDFVKQAKLHERNTSLTNLFGYRLPSDRIQADQLWQIIGIVADGSHWREFAIEKRYPFLHKPLVEYLLAIPLDQKIKQDNTRYLMRRALAGIVPKEILNRKSKGVAGETICRGLAEEGYSLHSMLATPKMCQLGYVDHSIFMDAFNKIQHGRILNLGEFLNTIALEIWLRSIEYHLPNFKKSKSSDFRYHNESNITTASITTH